MADEEHTIEGGAEDDSVEEDPAARMLPDDAVLAALVAPVPSADWEIGSGEWVISVDNDDYRDLIGAARAEGFTTFIDLCGVDYFRRTPRFEVVVTLLNYTLPMRLRVRAGVDGPEPKLPSISDIFAGANFYEREAFDLFGIDFTAHPDLTRILLPDEWEGYPLRKDYGVGTVPVQFKEAHKAN